MGTRWSQPRAPPVMLTQDVELAQWAGLLEHQPGVHAVPVKLMLTGQHPEPLWGGEGRKGSGHSCRPPGGAAPVLTPAGELKPQGPATPILLSAVLVEWSPGLGEGGSHRSADGGPLPGPHLLVAEIVQAHGAGLRAQLRGALRRPAQPAAPRLEGRQPAHHAALEQVHLGGRTRTVGQGRGRGARTPHAGSHLASGLLLAVPGRLPLGLQHEACAQEHGHQQDGVPQLLQRLLGREQGVRDTGAVLFPQ